MAPASSSITVFDCAKFSELWRATGLTPTEFAASVHCSPVWLWRLETGRSKPNIAMLGRIAAALGLPPGELLTVRDPARAEPAA
jgi:transcriptional regulator with XRE-family HTH domain